MLALRAVVLLLVVALVGSTGVFSQEKKETKESTKEMKESKDSSTRVKGTLPKHWSKIGLNETQRQEAYKTRARFEDQIQKLQEQIKSLRAEEKRELDKILTPEQKKRLTELQTGDEPKT